MFITGHTGFKGAWLSRILVNAGADVTGYSLEPPTEPNLFTIAGLSENITSVLGDIRDRDKLMQVFYDAQPEIVFHLAAQPIVRGSYLEPAYTYETNVMGTVNILECVRTLQVPGRGAIARTIHWMDTTHIQTQSPVRSLLFIVMSIVSLHREDYLYPQCVQGM